MKINFFGKLLIKIYQFLSFLLLPLLALLIFYRKIKSKEHPKRFMEKFALTNAKFSYKNSVIWIHAVSIGEANSAWILVEELLKSFKDINILFTTTTTTSAQIIENKIINSSFKNNIIHQFLPLDSIPIIIKFFKYWQPKLCIFIESEIWPNIIFHANKLNIPCALINMRISKKSAKKWNNLRKIGFDIFSFYKIIFAQSKTDQNNLQQITSKEIFYAINLKSCCQNLTINNSELAKIKSQIGARKILLYSSTHSLEEIEIIKIHKILQKEFPNLITIIIIRHPNRLNEVAKIIDENNLNFAIRSKNNPIIDSTDIYLVDTLGEVGIFYELVDFAFIGGSIVNVGGHNPYEAINLNCVPITGKFHYNFQDVYHEIFLKDSGFLINNSLELTALLGEILKNPNILEKYKNNLKNLQNKNTQEVKNIILKLKEII